MSPSVMHIIASCRDKVLRSVLKAVLDCRALVTSVELAGACEEARSYSGVWYAGRARGSGNRRPCNVSVLCPCHVPQRSCMLLSFLLCAIMPCGGIHASSNMQVPEMSCNMLRAVGRRNLTSRQ
eukprot:758466-Amphidinium_carterae.1